jgi:DNA-binding SARP family transcriptional activator
MGNVSQHRPLHVHLLGDFRLAHGEETVTSVNTSRLQSLLAYLILHRDAPQSRHHTAFLFWPDSTEAQALTNLRNLLHHLRHALPDADRFLQVDTLNLQWQSDVPFTLDVADFEAALARAEQTEQAGDQATYQEALEEAVAIYQGDLLPSSYADWIGPERERLQQAFIGALERLTRLLEEKRNYPAAIDHAQRLLRHDSLDEATYRQLMRLYALSGNRAAALRTYHTCATVLRRELGMDPSPPTRRAYERVLQAKTLPAPSQSPAAVLPAAASLVGRHREWAQLQSDWRAASAGQPRFVLVTGEAGIGKTRLAEGLIQWVERQGFTAASARCYAAGGGLAYGPVSDWLRARPLPPLEPVWLREIARILPELLARRPDLAPPGPLAEPWQRQQLYQAMARAVLGNNQPLLLMIDELQWCDRGTLEWLLYLLHFDPQARMLVIGTSRPLEAGDSQPLASLMQALRRDDQLAEIDLKPLDEASTAALAADVAGRELDPDMATCLYRETEGNPLFAIETVRMGLVSGAQDPSTGSGEIGSACLPRPLPSKIQAAIEGRLAQLSAPARELAELAAAIGREFSFAVLAQASDQDEGALVRALDELWQRRIVHEQGADGYDFGHDKLREVAYAGLSTARRRLVHRRVAQALENVHAGDLDSVSAQVAAHYEGAGEPERAIQYYQRGAKAAQAMCASTEAIEYYQRALALLEALPADESRQDWRRDVAAKIHQGLRETHDLVARLGEDPGLCQVPGPQDR